MAIEKIGFLKKVIMALMVSVLFCLTSGKLMAQDDDGGQYDSVMKEGVEMMDSGNYSGADEKFKIVLRNMKVLPSDICYFFGKNSYFLGQYKQGINWLNKYIELKGTGGEYFEDCRDYLTRSEKAFNLEEGANREKVQDELSRQNEFNCDGKSFMRCPICLGEGVLIKPGKLGTIYETCPYCKGEGKITCEDYKKYLRGELNVNE
jgi:hypothetical protein